MRLAAGTHRARRRAGALLVGCLLALGTSVAVEPVAAAQSESSGVRAAKAERDRIARELDDALADAGAERGQLDSIRRQLADAQAELRVAEGQLALAEEALTSAEIRIDVAEQELAIAERLLGDAERELALEQEDFELQVVTAYKYGAAAKGEMVLRMFQTAESPADLTNSLYRIGAVIDHQDSIIERVTRLRDEAAQAEAEAIEAGEAAEDARRDAEEELAFVASRREEAQTLKALVAEQEAAQARVFAQASGEAQSLRVALEAAEKRVREEEAKQRRDQAAARGGVICPIDPVWFSNDWGYPRSGGRTHKGNDLFADRGTPIIAMADATIRNIDRTDTYVPGTSRGDLGGISISYWLDAGEYWYFSHLESIEPGLSEGQAIAMGQVIGYVGTSGNAYNTPPHAHVGRYVGGTAVNPYPTLKPACG